MESSYLMFLALLPGIIILIFIYRKDKVEKEPKGLLILLLCLGAISCVPAVIAEIFMGGMMPASLGNSVIGYALFNAFLVAALCEEFFKYILLKIGSWKSKEFNYRFDGIVYGVCVALGFALFENVLYCMQGGLETALMRGLLAVPLHSFCGVYMGIYYGLAKQLKIQGKSAIGAKFKALFIPFMIHGIYDTCAFVGNIVATVVLLAFVALLYIIAIRAVNKYSREDWQHYFYAETQEI